MEINEEKLLKKNKTPLCLLIGALILAICGYAFYACYWIKTPAYSLKLIHGYIIAHDSEHFEKQTDLLTLCSTGTDALIDYSIGMDLNDPSVSPFIKAMLGTVKNAIVPELLSQSRNFVTNGKFRKNNPQLQGPVLISDPLEKYAGLSFWEFKGVTKTTKHKDSADVEFRIFDKQIGKEFVLKVKMLPLKDGTWRLSQIINLPDYLKAYEIAKAAKLKEVNAKISAQIASALKIGPMKAPKIKVKKSSLLIERRLIYTIPVTKETDDAFSFIGELTVRDKDDNFIASKTVKDALGTGHKGESFTGNIEIELNPFIGKQNKLTEADLATLKTEYVISSISFQDGKEYSLAKDLPTTAPTK